MMQKLHWNLTEKILFRFSFIYFLLYCLPFPLNRIPLLNKLGNVYVHFKEEFVSLFSNLFFSREITNVLNGSGDTSFDYLSVFVLLGVSVIIAILWSIMDRKRPSYNTLFTWQHVYLRFYLALVLFGYGITKLFINQFSELSLLDLIKTYGESTPMGLAWNFMEYSDSYTFFSGLMETIAGLLLCFRKTTKLGAICSFGVMLNVFMMNMSFDIPVKLYSGHLMIISLYLLIPYSKQLLQFFILNKPTTAPAILPYFKKKWVNITTISFKFLALIIILYSTFDSGSYSRKTYGKDAPKPVLYGIYDLINDTEDSTQDHSWNKLVIDKYYTIVIDPENKKKNYRTTIDTTDHAIYLKDYYSTDSLQFRYTIKDSILQFTGIDNDSLRLRFRQFDHNSMPLLKTGFNWINEYPNNR
ncbi:DoxX family membrane protein [Robertkochia solimangrovi]|uniref:DoxX family membrane protein n=1 Tax=Robertkochia solimangrovi TaxID=2213046 RepID=UPI0011809746|nr:DoxX family membrane protein [Robertkochia solimangrovi]TRZ46222.1 hypothetical protein DMZ48_02910 [Robertkochia solimangrovi]